MIRQKSVTVKVLTTPRPGHPVLVHLSDYAGPRCCQGPQTLAISYDAFKQYEREACVTMERLGVYRCHDYYWTAQ